MINPITPDSPSEEIEAFTQMLPKLASFLNQDEQAKRWLAALGEGHISEAEFMLKIAERMDAMGIDLA